MSTVVFCKSGCSSQKKPPLQPDCNQFFLNHQLQFFFYELVTVAVFSNKTKEKPVLVGNIITLYFSFKMHLKHPRFDQVIVKSLRYASKVDFLKYYHKYINSSPNLKLLGTF